MPRVIRCCSICAVRFENARSRASLIPAISRQQLRFGPQATPSLSERRRRSSSWYTEPAALAQLYRAEASSATQHRRPGKPRWGSRVRVQLRVPRPARSMHKGGRRPP
jgi:hypothetical protein